MDRRELAALLDLVCERPLSEDVPEVSPAAARRLGEALADAEMADGAELEPGALADALAAILSGTATEAQCRAFRAAAIASAAVRAEAQSALAFVEAVDEPPLAAAPAHLVDEVSRCVDRPSGKRSDIWAPIAAAPARAPIIAAAPPEAPWRARRASVAAVLTVMLAVFGVGLSWPLVWRTAPATEGPVVMPVSEGPTVAPASVAAPNRAVTSAFDLAPALPPSAPPAASPPPLPQSVPVLTTAEPPADPCAPPRNLANRNLGKSKLAKSTAEAGVAKPAPRPTVRTAVASLPATGCADAALGVGAPVAVERPATLSNRRLDRDPFASGAAPAAVPPMTYAPASSPAAR